ncbi:alpha/beta hydrolase [Xanthomonas cerealis pv. cerealis]|uniref:Alpha/beta hydrolase n=1 Tax=Xanthomonas cerealis pv. cerealis TaxID=152263 RepID=A0A514EI92_9XANT|nr:alpha/beta hydrolase [Xanthomonas translucens pv. cerealis]UKE48909.1 alpha/beta hydrolase [Xanthomonas translucens pv. cerealis]
MHRLLRFPFAVIALVLVHAPAHAAIWQPSPGHVQLPIWPGAVPDALSHPKPEAVGPGEGRTWWARANDVSQPTMTVYAPTVRNSGTAVVVFPGGGYQVMAMDLEGTEICHWLTSRGITCVLLKYRVPNSEPTWINGGRYYPKVQTALQHAQRMLGLVRLHAAEWGIDPHKVGVIGFSAGGHLVAAASTHFAKRTSAVVDAADAQSCRLDFAIAAYPGHLWAHEDEDHAKRDPTHLQLRTDIALSADTPPTFLLQAEDDVVDGVMQSLAYYVALKQAGVPTEMHLYAQGGHAFGLRPSTLPIAQWPRLVEKWLGTIGVLDTVAARRPPLRCCRAGSAPASPHCALQGWSTQPSAPITTGSS